MVQLNGKSTVLLLIVLLLLFLIAVTAGYRNSTVQGMGEESEAAAGQLPLESRPCSVQALAADIELACYWIYLSSDRVKTTSSPRLAVTVLQSHRPEVMAAEPLVYLPGGPGTSQNSTSAILEFWLAWYQKSALERPLVLLDYRHLAPSEPHFVCAEYRRLSKATLKQNLTIEQEITAINATLSSCLQQANSALGTKENSFPLHLISSRQNAEDVHTALIALGYSAWHLLAVSYGTRVALLAALSQPEVRSVILDSPTIFSAGRDSDIPRLWQRALTDFFNRCADSERCRETGLSEVEFWRLMAYFKANPRRVISENWDSQVAETWLLNDVRLAASIFGILYSGGADKRIASFLKGVKQGQDREVLLELEMFYNQLIDPSFYEWIFIVTSCNDGLAETAEQYQTRIANTGAWGQLFRGQQVDTLCDHPLLRPIPLPAMGTIKQPVLLVSGEFDPVTPVEDAKTLLPWLDNGTLRVQAGGGHAEFFGSDCGTQTIKSFLQRKHPNKIKLMEVCKWL